MAATAKISYSPVTWPMWWRIIILLNVSFYNLMGNVFSAGAPPLFGLLIEEFHCTSSQASDLVTYSVLTLGLSNVFALPAVEYLGKRFTILISMLIFLASNIWAANAHSYNSLLATRFVGGISAGMIEALGPFIVSECFPEHQLARAMVVYVVCLAAGSAIGPLVSGGVASGLKNWRWFFGVSAIAIGINFITSVLMLPETTQITESTALEIVTTPTPSEAEKDAPAYIEDSPEAGDKQESLKSVWIKRSFYIRPTFLKSNVNPIKIFLSPFRLLICPPVFLATLVFGITIGWTVLVSIIIANVFSAPPKSWQAYQVGLMNCGPLIGLLLGFPIGGMAADFLSKRALKRSDGEHEPQVRLPAIIFGGVVSPAGCILMGYVLQNNSNSVLLSLGWGMLCFGLTASANVVLTYCIDCFRSQAGEIGVLVNVVKNLIGFGVSYASMTWYYHSGAKAQFGTMAGLSWAAYLLAIPVYIWSPRLVKFSERTLHL